MKKSKQPNNKKSSTPIGSDSELDKQNQSLSKLLVEVEEKNKRIILETIKNNNR
ncbi:MAG: hypothetical protein ACJAX3_002264 [Patiriisocius sp.]